MEFFLVTWKAFYDDDDDNGGGDGDDADVTTSFASGLRHGDVEEMENCTV
jgi:hypothetical protein